MYINFRGFTAFVSWQHLNIPQTYSSQAVQRKIMVFIYFTQISVDFFHCQAFRIQVSNLDIYQLAVDGIF
jgi:hypothetical protein